MRYWATRIFIAIEVLCVGACGAPRAAHALDDVAPQTRKDAPAHAGDDGTSQNRPTAHHSTGPVGESPAVPIAVVPGSDAIPTPASFIGHEVGADFKIARWEQIVDYFETIDPLSDRIRVRRIDTSTEGAPYILAEISSADTIRDIDRYQRIQARIADPRLIADAAERARLLEEGKPVIVVSCSLHSVEIGASQMSMELAYNLITRDDEHTREILDNCIILLVPSANPDGINKIADWYDRTLNTPFEGGRMPWLYQKYAGHDNNRDWFMLNLEETRTLTRVLYKEWHPTVMYDVHQMGNRGARFFVPPFFDPVNPNVHPLIHQSIMLIGGHMATLLQENGRSGVVYKAIFDNWWQGGNRTTPYRHNIVGILTEAASPKVATPVFQEYRSLRGGGRGFPDYSPAVNFPEPWPGGWWRLRDVIEYEMIACDALFTLASRYRERFVRNHLWLGEEAIRKGRDEPPYAWLVPPDQTDPGAAAHMLEILHATGIDVHQAKAPFTADGVAYPAGTYVLLAAQPFRPHLKDMMERQEYPNRAQYPGGPPEGPYDMAGWTLPLQMGVRSVAVVAPFDADLAEATAFESYKTAIKADRASGFYVTRRTGNYDYATVNALLDAGADVRVLTEGDGDLPAGSIAVTASDPEAWRTVWAALAASSAKAPIRFDHVDSLSAKTVALVKPRTALYQPWTASMDEGWTRLVLERFEFPYETLHNAEVRAGKLRDRFDCIIIPDLRLGSLLDGHDDTVIPPPYAGGIGKDGAMALERFVEQGGTLVLMDSATRLATDLLRVPVKDALAGVASKDFFCPGSIVRLRVDNGHPLGFGFGDEAAGFFARSQAFVTGKAALEPEKAAAKDEKDGAVAAALTDAEIEAKLEAQPVTTVVSYSDNIVLLSGWIHGEERLRNRSAVCEVGYGKGRIVLLGFRVQHRAQPWGTFKFLFNAIYWSGMGE